MEIKKILKKLSVHVQKSHTSYDRHNRQLESKDELELARLGGTKRINTNEINSASLRINDLLLMHPTVKIAVDIGSGAGWGSASLSKLVDEVIAIEPSQAGINIATQLYSATEYPNIVWKNGFAEDALELLTLDAPTLFMTGCVLSHLRDKEVLSICQKVNLAAPENSVLSFSEAWHEDEKWHQIMWHVRTKDWWQKALPGWELDFHGPAGDDYKKCHMGFWGVKVTTPK